MDDDTTQKPTPTTPPEAGQAVTLAFSGAERELLVLALGELLSSARRDEHLIPAIQALLARLQSAGPAA
jgi:hypothetical protein